MRWRLLLDDPGPPAWNMAVDEVLLGRYGAEDEGAPPTLRLYGWAPAALSLGRRQALDIAQPSLTVVRRPTGGQAVLHDDERTYAVAGALRRAPFPGGVVDTYRRIAAALVVGLRRLGLETVAAVPMAGSRVSETVSCFDTLGAHEIAWSGRKLVGSAQVRSRWGFLQHGSLPLSLDPGRVSSLLGQPVAGDRFTDLERALQRRPSREEIDAALRAGFAEAFDCAFEEDALTEAERCAAEVLAGTKYAPVYSGAGTAPSAAAASWGTTVTGTKARPSAPRS